MGIQHIIDERHGVILRRTPRDESNAPVGYIAGSPVYADQGAAARLALADKDNELYLSTVLPPPTTA